MCLRFWVLDSLISDTASVDDPLPSNSDDFFVGSSAAFAPATTAAAAAAVALSAAAIFLNLRRCVFRLAVFGSFV